MPSEKRSENMRRIRSRDSTPELAVRRFLFRLGYRYRIHVKGLPGCPDICFPGIKKAIFVHGCFWHAHRGCRFAHEPQSNASYWVAKIRRNVERHERVALQLAASGWQFLVIWECETKVERHIENCLGPFLQDSNAKRHGEADARH